MAEASTLETEVTIESVLERVQADGAAARAINEPDFLKKILADADAAVKAAPVDLKTQKGRKAVASVAAKVASIKTTIDAAGKGICDEWNAKIDKINAIRRPVRKELDALKAKARKPLDEWEQAEAARKAELEALLKRIQDAAVVTISTTAEQIAARREEIAVLTFSDNQFPPPELEQLNQARLTTLKGLDHDLEMARDREAKEAELTELRQREAEREAEEAKRAKEATPPPASAQTTGRPGARPKPKPAGDGSNRLNETVGDLLTAADYAGLPLAPGVAKALAAALSEGRIRNVQWVG